MKISLPHSTTRWPLWILPLISAAAWFAMLWAMLIVWLAQGRPFYPSMERGNVAYISDIGAYDLKPLFITGASITSVFFFLSLAAMRLNQSLPKRAERCLDLSALILGLLGAVSLILLSIFDTHNHDNLHRLFLFLFMVGVIFSALFSTIEYYRLGRTFTEHPILKWSFRGKALVFIVELLLCVAFAVLMSLRRQTQGAIIEWVIAFTFTLYLGTLWLDLLPRARTKEVLGMEMEQAGRESEEEGAAAYSHQQRGVGDLGYGNMADGEREGMSEIGGKLQGTNYRGSMGIAMPGQAVTR